MSKMSISNFLKESNIDLKKSRKPVKTVKSKTKICFICEKKEFVIIYKRYSKEILAYRCVYCGHAILVKSKKSSKKRGNDDFDENNVFECPLGGIEFCLDSCIFYGNLCELR